MVEAGKALTINLTPILIPNRPQMWIGTLELDGEQIAERRGTSINDVLEKIEIYFTEKNNVLPNTWKK